MLRRVHFIKLTLGSIALPVAEAHHVRDVLRLEAGASVELFDNAGAVAVGVIRHVNAANVVVQVDAIQPAVGGHLTVVVAAAVPKGDRADWMVEKLSELGVSRFIPLVSERSVVLPGGRNKIERWERIAVEAAKQCRRSGVMTIGLLSPLEEVLATIKTGIYFSISDDAVAIRQAMDAIDAAEVTLLIGPEGGWSDAEQQKMKSAGLIAARLTRTVLRIETAAAVAAGVVLCLGTNF